MNREEAAMAEGAAARECREAGRGPGQVRRASERIDPAVGVRIRPAEGSAALPRSFGGGGNLRERERQ